MKGKITFGLIKPNVTSCSKKTEWVFGKIEQHGFKIIKSKKITLDVEAASEFYSEHRGKFFYPRLIRFMTSGDVIAFIAEKENAIEEWRKLMGPTRLKENRDQKYSNTIRNKSAYSDTLNSVHGSDKDSLESAKREIDFFFSSGVWDDIKKIKE